MKQLIRDYSDNHKTIRIAIEIFGDDNSFDTSFSQVSIPGNKVLVASDLIHLYPEVNPNYYHDDSKMVKATDDKDEEVYFCEDRVVKIYSPKNGTLDEFYREIIVGLEIAKLNNPCFAKTLGYATIEKHDQEYTLLYIEKIEGMPLWDFIYSASFEEIKSVMLKLVEGYVDALQKLNFTHYDLHLANVIVQKNGDPKIIDFGAAHISLPEGDLGEEFRMFARYADRSMWTQDFFKIFAQLWRKGFVDLDELEDAISKRLKKYSGKSLGYFRGALEEYFEKVKTFIPESDIKKAHESMNVYKKNLKLYKSGNAKKLYKFAKYVLRYLHPGINNSWLSKAFDADPYFASYPTEEGEKADFLGFVEHVRSVVNSGK